MFHLGTLPITKTYYTLYELLHDKRTALFNRHFADNTKFVQQTKERDEGTQKFLSSLKSGDVNSARIILVRENKRASIVSHQPRTVCLMDAATG